jgi:Carboxypeptidase regulatory-like domain
MRGAAVATLLLLSSLQTQIGNVEGVVRETTGGPLRGALIRLTTARPGETRQTSFSATTDAEGRFRLIAPPADYTVTVQSDGYYGPPLYGVYQRVVTRKLLVTEQVPPILNFTLIPSATIAGSLLDHAGRPAIRVGVAAMQIRYSEGRPSLVEVGTATTNERGEYRLFWLPPGEYVVAFNPSLSAVASPPIISAGNRQSAQTCTFYPGTPDITKATTLNLAPSAEIRGIDFAVQTTDVVTISGAINNPDVSLARRPESTTPVSPAFSLVPRASPLTSIVMSGFANALPLQARQQGLFEFRGIPPGSYDLYASVPAINAGNPGLAGRLSIDISSHDVKDISIPVRPLYELRGRIVEEGESLPEKTTIRIVPIDGRRAIPSEVTADSSGEFSFKNLQSGSYRLDFTLPPNAFLADVRQGQQSRYGDNSFQLSDESAEPVQLLLRAKAPSVEGTVVAPAGKALADTSVVLVPEKSLRGNFILYKTARAEESGQFTVTNVSPGAYKIFAWEGVLSTAWLNEDFLAKYEERGSVITVGSSATSGVRVNVILLQ